MKKVNVYIDWFNFYYALQNRIHDRSSWWTKEFQRCDFHKLFAHFLQVDEIINKIYFFTAYRKWDINSYNRHKTYLQALAKYQVRIILWNYQSKINMYRKWKNKIEEVICEDKIDNPQEYIEDLKKLAYHTFEEKETDVKIALQIVEDAFLWEYDHAYIVSGDSDIIPSIQTIKKLVKKSVINNKIFSSILLPWTKGQKIKEICDYKIDITTQQMKNSILPHSIAIGNQSISIPKERL